jgi:pimeloyl-ACP methyl ester carboxylesterase
MSKLLIFIPGNPSIPGIYDTFIEHLQTSLHPLRSYVLSHRGQDESGGRVERVDSLDLLIQHHRRRIEDIIQQEAPTQLYLVGHSLGTTIAISLYPTFATHIEKLVLLCPFLGPQAHNKPLLQALSVKTINQSLQFLVRQYLTFDRPSRYLLQRRLGLGQQADSVHRSLTTQHFLGNFLGLVSGYTRFFNSNNLIQQLAELPLPDTLFLFASNDYWVPDHTIDTLPQGANYQQLTQIEHAFCLQPAQASLVADACATFLRDESRRAAEPA